MKTIALIGTFDTKGEEYLYVKNKIENLGLRTLTIHAGIFEAAFSPDYMRRSCLMPFLLWVAQAELLL